MPQNSGSLSELICLLKIDVTGLISGFGDLLLVGQYYQSTACSACCVIFCGTPLWTSLFFLGLPSYSVLDFCVLYVFQFRLHNFLCLSNANFHHLILLGLFLPHVPVINTVRTSDPSTKPVQSQISARSAINSSSPQISVYCFIFALLSYRKRKKKKNLVKTSTTWEKAIIKIRSPSATFLFAGTCTFQIQSKMLGGFFPPNSLHKAGLLVVSLFHSARFLVP